MTENARNIKLLTDWLAIIRRLDADRFLDTSAQLEVDGITDLIFDQIARTGTGLPSEQLRRRTRAT